MNASIENTETNRKTIIFNACFKSNNVKNVFINKNTYWLITITNIKKGFFCLHLSKINQVFNTREYRQ